jgi:hypothetical protein
MSLDYNIEPSHNDLVFKQNDTIDISFRVYLNNGSDPNYPLNDPHYWYDVTGMQIDAYFRRKDGLLVKKLSTLTGEITILTSTYNMAGAGFSAIDVLDYDVQITDGTTVMTFQYGQAIVTKEIVR